jgi:hypothetical protein
VCPQSNVVIQMMSTGPLQFANPLTEQQRGRNADCQVG